MASTRPDSVGLSRPDRVSSHASDLERHPDQHSGQHSVHAHSGTKSDIPTLRNTDLNLGQSPIKVDSLLRYLQDYVNVEDANLLADGFLHGFKIEYSGPRSAFECRNLKSAYDHRAELLAKVDKEISLGRIAGPFPSPPFSNLHVSPIGVVPKSDGGWRLITHLSYPEGASINFGIDPQFCKVKYTSFDQVTSLIYSLGRSALIAKRDLKSAYRLLPIRCQDFTLLGMKIDDVYYVDKFLPMGLSQSAFLFEKFSTFLHWVVAEKANSKSLAHLLDDFLLAGPANSHQCRSLVEVFESTCQELGVPIAEEKSVDPTTIMVFLGLEIDTNEMSVRIPVHRIVELQALLHKYISRKKMSLKELQSLVGKLNFFGQAVRSSRAFLRRFYDSMTPLKKPHHVLRLSRELKEDLALWLEFLVDFNGVTYIPSDDWLSSETLRLFTDASGSTEGGGGCFLNGEWCFFPWPTEWAGHTVLRDMSFLEMVPVLLSLYLWGTRIANRRIVFYIDNMALVQVINKQSAKSKRLMRLIRPFILICMRLNIIFKASHISSQQNIIADAISRQQWIRFRQAAPEAHKNPCQPPQDFTSLISTLKLDD